MYDNVIMKLNRINNNVIHINKNTVYSEKTKRFYTNLC